MNSGNRALLKVVVGVICYVVFLAILVLLMSCFDIETTMWKIIMVICAIPGWRFLSTVLPVSFSFSSAGVFVGYLIVKLALSILVGVFVAPWMFAKLVLKLIP